MNVFKTLIDKIKVEKNHIAKHLFISMFLILFLSLIRGNSYALLDVADNMFIVSLIYILIVLFRVVVKLRFFDLFTYGIKKILEIIFTKDYGEDTSEIGSYTDYLETLDHKRPIFNFVLLSIILTTCSYLLIVISIN